MDESFSPAANRLLAEARRLAWVNNQAQASAREILAAILQESEGEGAQLLRQAGADFGRLLELLGVGSRTTDGAWSEASPPDWDPHALSVIRRAQEIAVRFTRLEPTSTLDVLVAILEDPRELEPLLVGCGVDPAEAASAFHRRRQPEVIPVSEEELGWTSWSSMELTDVTRIVDANLNRVREALRVVEEYARFALDNRSFSERLKLARHRVAEISSHFPSEWLLGSRATEVDVGAALPFDRELQRNDLASVVTANMKRAQEALRAIEEYAKVESRTAAEIARRLRYEVYTLERSYFVLARSRDRLGKGVLYWLCDPWSCHGSVEWTLREAVDGGVQIVQLRDKQSSDRDRIDLARRMREWTRDVGALFIVNDRADIARLVRADGVHLGQEDLSVRDARRVIGPDALIGVSVHNLDQLREAHAEGADYVGVGPVFESKTKRFERFPGLEFLASACLESALPLFAIGGIDATNIDAVLETGARRIAVGHAICSSDDPRAASRDLASRLAAVHEESEGAVHANRVPDTERD